MTERKKVIDQKNHAKKIHDIVILSVIAFLLLPSANMQTARFIHAVIYREGWLYTFRTGNGGGQ